MSLDIYIHDGYRNEETICHCCGTKIIESVQNEVYSTNITHNLGKMAKEAGIYEILWRIEESGIFSAGEIVEKLQAGIKLMESEPERFIPLSASNGWGTYQQFIPWLKELLQACKDSPESFIKSSR